MYQVTCIHCRDRNLLIECACGCGGVRPRKSKNYAYRRYIGRHYQLVAGEQKTCNYLSEEKICKRCFITLGSDNTRRRKKFKRLWCIECENEMERQRRSRNREIVLTHYGPYCVCCGEKQDEFLGIDHINGGGAKHRREKEIYHIYDWLIKNGFPDGFRTMCFNCNAARGYRGYCPHELKRQMTTAG